VDHSAKISVDDPHKQPVNTKLKAQIYRYLSDQAQPYPLGDHDF
jgi:hypothetical protein